MEPESGHHYSAWFCLTLPGKGTSCLCQSRSLTRGCLAQRHGCAAGELPHKTQRAREVVWACGGIPSLRSGAVSGDVVLPLAVTLGWELWLWE